MKDTEFISQMANIASLEQMQQFTQGSKFADSQKDMVAQAYLGRMVSISDKAEVSGLVESVEKSETARFRSLFPVKYDPQSITRVSCLTTIRNDPFATQWNHYVEKPFSRASGFGQQHRQRQFPRLQVFPGKLFGQFYLHMNDAEAGPDGEPSNNIQQHGTGCHVSSVSSTSIKEPLRSPVLTWTWPFKGKPCPTPVAFLRSPILLPVNFFIPVPVPLVGQRGFVVTRDQYRYQLQGIDNAVTVGVPNPATQSLLARR